MYSSEQVKKQIESVCLSNQNSQRVIFIKWKFNEYYSYIPVKLASIRNPNAIKLIDACPASFGVVSNGELIGRAVYWMTSDETRWNRDRSEKTVWTATNKASLSMINSLE